MAFRNRNYILVFEVATILALRHREGLEIWNCHPPERVHKLDPKADMKEHPGVFSFELGCKTMAVAGDGRMLDGSGRSLWLEYMQGETPYGLALSIETSLSG